MQTVQEPQIPTSIMETVQELRAPAHNGPLNILLLGASGVGKSTFINALCNYLTYRTLDEAVKGELQSLIYCEFQDSNPDSKGHLSTKKIVVGKPDIDEGGAKLQAGASCTQRCKAYTLPLGECGEVRLIDTPGILDTRGVDADADNMKHILAFLARYEVLHAVCILLKPNEVRLTNSLKYSIVQLLEKLHKDASRNILFCFTNSRSTRYKVEGTLPLLEDMLKDIKVNIDLRGDSSMYYFDSEAFRYQAIMKQGGDFDEEEFKDYERSWNKSAGEAARLIGHISTLEPHHLKDTLSLNRVRSLLESIQQPLGQLTANIQDNLQQIKRTREEIEKGHGDERSYFSKLLIVETYQKTVALAHPEMVCTEKKCEGSVCHANCIPTETAMGMFENLEGNIMDKVSRLPVSFAGFNVSGLVNPELKLIRKLTGSTDDAVFCKELSYTSGKCKVCKCPNSRHMRVYTKMEPATRTIKDENIQKVLDDTTSITEKKESILKILERKEEAMQDENKVVVEAAALFAGFLEQNSIVTYHSAISDYYKEEKMKMKREGNLERAQELDEILQLYEKTVRFFTMCRVNCTDAGDSNITEARVNEELQKLYKLELHGPQLKAWMDKIERAAEFEENQAKARGEAVYKAPVLSTNNAAGVHDGSRPKGLREKIAQEWNSRPRK
ncbi:hypothetical protein KC19_2G108400 [Ceratodon purpureus]|uniref:G domain-containing protein n=1 Tax=Ceratodon purpureus TaxID=3225 RepID=A0A8T0IVH5_CERPU|nr:hypothetical protein KC19_2G108400 [Ceratodon purpureus]